LERSAETERDGREVILYANHHGHWASWRFGAALGDTRGVFGVHIGQLAVRYEVELPDHMEAILPASPADDDASEPRRGWFDRFRGRG